MADQFDSRYDAVFQRGFEPAALPPRIEVVDASDPPAVHQMVEQLPEADPPAVVNSAEVTPHGINPYFVALWVIAVAFVVLGAWLYFSTLLISFSGAQDASRLFALLGYVFGGPLVTIGLATIVGLVFVKAARLLGPRR
jgi:hypothetical protein